MDILKKLEAIKQDRFDLADYVIHFTRGDTKSSFEVLQDIVTSGQINCGWSVRNTKRTIFGDKPAICFTDMPLYSFYRYVFNRKDFSKVDFYGVALHKTKMFQLGARNVIYGTTVDNETETQLTGGEMQNPNLSPGEQYRYMLTSIGDKNDWTHEREWRWTNHFGKSNGDYLPVWKNNNYDEYFGGDIEFYQEKGIFIIVRLDSEIDTLEGMFATFTDQNVYNQPNISRTFAVSLESLRSNDRLTYDKLDFISLITDGVYRKMPCR